MISQSTRILEHKRGGAVKRSQNFAWPTRQRYVTVPNKEGGGVLAIFCTWRALYKQTARGGRGAQSVQLPEVIKYSFAERPALDWKNFSSADTQTHPLRVTEIHTRTHRNIHKRRTHIRTKDRFFSFSIQRSDGKNLVAIYLVVCTQTGSGERPVLSDVLAGH